ncbi:GTP-binding protein [Zavarzinia sp. CC-PAN008]|uniref:GTP-binding protein n=1 Tax=Zavarzinia sp. CC-PAN008 TaxID=3243332 RepID=UPI003F746DC8
MRLRTFTAATMAEAMAQVRDALGDDAIIVATKRGDRGRGVTITAAAEQPGEPAIEPAPMEAQLEANLLARLAAGMETVDRDPITTAPAAQPGERRGLAAEERREDLARVLSFHRPPDAVATVLGRAAQALSGASLADALAQALETTFRFAPLPDQPQRSLLLVGPPGAGKSVTAAKLAARATLAGRPSRLITADTLRAGAVQQMEVYARALGQTLGLAPSAEALHKIQRDARRAAPAIVDTPGTNPYNPAERDALKRMIAVSEAEPVLVLAAGGDAAETADLAQVFRNLGCRRLIATRVDAARRLGSILAALDAGGLALSDLGQTPYVGQGLTPAASPILARLLLRPLERTAEFDDLEQALP